MEDRRKHKRYFIFDILYVSIEGLGEGVGHLVDLTPEGIMIRCGVPVEPGTRHELSVELREPLHGEQMLRMSADCQWCRQAPSLGGYNVGYQLVNEDLKTAKIIAALTQAECPAAG